MIGKLLMRGMLAGLCAGLITFGFAKVFGEPQVDRAIAFETHQHALESEAPEPELVSRETQAGLGLLTGVVVYGVAFGGLFALAFAYAHGRVPQVGARTLSMWLSIAAFVALVLVPTLKYPANPPSVGNPDTIGSRTALYFFAIAISVCVTIVSIDLRRRAVAHIGRWNGSIVAALAYVAVMALAMHALPDIDEVPLAFPAAVLWKFRVAAIGMQAVLWTTVGLVFGSYAERLYEAPRSGRFRLAGWNG